MEVSTITILPNKIVLITLMEILKATITMEVSQVVIIIVFLITVMSVLALSSFNNNSC